MQEDFYLKQAEKALSSEVVRFSYQLRRLTRHRSVKNFATHDQYVRKQLRIIQKDAVSTKQIRKRCQTRLQSILGLSSSRLAWRILKAAQRPELAAYRSLKEFTEVMLAIFTTKDGEISLFGRQPRELPKRVDVAIVTTIRFPGGNASSTLDEIRTFKAAGLSVVLIHCPLNNNRHSISARYSSYVDDVVLSQDVRKPIEATTLILRAPRMILSEQFARLAPNLSAKRCVAVINNSAYRPSGEPIYRHEDVLAAMGKIRAERKTVHPLGPAIRSEMERLGVVQSGLVAAYDWPPTFDTSSIIFGPKAQFSVPAVIGRHGRDGSEKWLSDPKELLQVYPEDGTIRVKILGGADNAASVLHRKPRGWTIYPFGAKPPAEYLTELDCFVYFPHEGLNEAFGRTIMEAIFAGVPCIVPPRFEETFGDLAFYCEPSRVRSVVNILGERDADRLRFVTEARQVAMTNFASGVLFERAPELGIPAPEVDNKRRALSPDVVAFKKWVQASAEVHQDSGMLL